MRRKHDSQLRVIRRATGLFQEQFAARVGIPKGTVENYEMGRAKLPERLALQIGALVGIVPSTLQNGHKLISYNGKPFSKRTYDNWKTITHTEFGAPCLIGVGKERLNTLLTAALGPTLRNQRPPPWQILRLDRPATRGNRALVEAEFTNTLLTAAVRL